MESLEAPMKRRHNFGLGEIDWVSAVYCIPVCFDGRKIIQEKI